MTAPPSSPPGPPSQPSGGADPSMEDILASIRRILSEDEGEAPPKPASDVVALDSSMLVEEPATPPAAHAGPPAPPVRLPEPEESATVIASPPPAAVPPPVAPAPLPDGLLAPEAAAKASFSVGSLLRTLANERQQVAVRAGGPTIEDLVREEIRPLLKTWLDANLPPLVERLVRAEIERVVGRALS